MPSRHKALAARLPAGKSSGARREAGAGPAGGAERTPPSVLLGRGAPPLWPGVGGLPGVQRERGCPRLGWAAGQVCCECQVVTGASLPQTDRCQSTQASEVGWCRARGLGFAGTSSGVRGGGPRQASLQSPATLTTRTTSPSHRPRTPQSGLSKSSSPSGPDPGPKGQRQEKKSLLLGTAARGTTGPPPARSIQDAAHSPPVAPPSCGLRPRSDQPHPSLGPCCG